MSDVAIVNGGTRGIGKAIVDRLFCKGWNVYATGRKECDATNLFAIAQYVKTIPKINLLVNVAGIFEESEIIDEPCFDMDLFRTNLIGTWNWTRVVLPIMRKQKGGYIINISSMAAKRVRKGCSRYAMSKAAVNSFTEAILRENIEYGIRATAICPGDTDTEIGRRIAPGEELLPTDDIAKTVTWLTSLSKTAIIPEICIERIGRFI